MPRMERKTVRFSRAKPTMRRVSRSGLQSRRRSAAGAGAGGTPRLASQPAPARASTVAETVASPPIFTSAPPRIVPSRMAAKVPICKGVAADQLVGVEMLRQDAVLDRPEDRRVRAHQEDHPEQQGHAVEVEAGGPEQHDPDLEQLHEPDDPRLVELVRDLSRARREEEEGKREQAGAQVDERVLGERRAAHPEREQDDERVLEQVVVQGPQELGPEEGPEPSRPQQLELAHPLPRLISS